MKIRWNICVYLGKQITLPTEKDYTITHQNLLPEKTDVAIC